MELFQKHSPAEFESISMETFSFQYQNLDIYRNFIEFLGKKESDIKTLYDIPFLPVGFFKTHKIISNKRTEEIIFSSSGTTGMETSKHYIADLTLYEQSFLEGFRYFYGKPSDFCILALLPSYLERDGSSLVYMADRLIKQSTNKDSGFYLNQFDELVSRLYKLKNSGKKTLLLGVSFALLDLAEHKEMDLSHAIVMETGGMKGRRKELTREELHLFLSNRFNISEIHSEYGMTELLSQAYSKGNGRFFTPPWMKVIIKDPYDPFKTLQTGNTGLINIIDLANKYSCSFIATSDLGRLHPDGSFEVLGRMDNSELRGCNLMLM